MTWSRVTSDFQILVRKFLPFATTVSLAIFFMPRLYFTNFTSSPSLNGEIADKCELSKDLSDSILTLFLYFGMVSHT